MTFVATSRMSTPRARELLSHDSASTRGPSDERAAGLAHWPGHIPPCGLVEKGPEEALVAPVVRGQLAQEREHVLVHASVRAQQHDARVELGLVRSLLEAVVSSHRERARRKWLAKELVHLRRRMIAQIYEPLATVLCPCPLREVARSAFMLKGEIGTERRGAQLPTIVDRARIGVKAPGLCAPN
eukprot:6194481-Pleurochrysis_carterae.AAC.6